MKIKANLVCGMTLTENDDTGESGKNVSSSATINIIATDIHHNDIAKWIEEAAVAPQPATPPTAPCIFYHRENVPVPGNVAIKLDDIVRAVKNWTPEPGTSQVLTCDRLASIVRAYGLTPYIGLHRVDVHRYSEFEYNAIKGVPIAKFTGNYGDWL